MAAVELGPAAGVGDEKMRQSTDGGGFFSLSLYLLADSAVSLHDLLFKECEKMERGGWGKTMADRANSAVLQGKKRQC
jgi:hypothetical protein